MNTKYAEVPGDESGVPKYRQQTFQQKYFGGIKRTLRAFTIVAVIVLIINVVWLVYAKAKYGIVDGYGTIRKGECSSVKQLNAWLHLAINILSTLLLTGSNAFMACYSCPSREEVDQAHARFRSLHIGVLSFGNLRGIAKRKSLVVLVLALSSVPFHLLYNSLVFSSLSSNEYYWTVVSEDFLTGAAFNLTGDWKAEQLGVTNNYTQPKFLATPPSNEFGDLFFRDAATYMKQTEMMNDYYDNIQKSAPKWERLENAACINAYSNLFLTSRRNVVLVSSGSNSTITNTSNSILDYGSTDYTTGLDGNWWICSMIGQDGGNLFCNPRSLLSDASSWKVFDYPIEYCLSELKEDTCSVQFSLTIMWVVIGFNALKVAAMIWILLCFDAQKLLASVGDAAASFLTHDDPATLGICLADKRNIRSFWMLSRGQPRPYNFNRRSWGLAVSTGRWILFLLLMIFALLTVVIFAGWGFSHIKHQGIGFDPASLWSLGFGATNQNTMVLADNASSAVLMAILANIPQVILAGIYLVYLGIMSSMFIAADWSRFAFQKQTLMVSSAVGEQRGTWLLGAPLGYGIGLLGLHTLLHWFVSQSLFVVQMVIYNKNGEPDTDIPVLSNCGYSPIAIICSVVAAILLLLSALVTMVRRFSAGAPPVASTSSAAISAACHPVKRSDDLVYQGLMWGVNGGYGNGVEHCSLASAEPWNVGYIQAPRPGVLYAGHAEDTSSP